jgi:hypothetical protein
MSYTEFYRSEAKHRARVAARLEQIDTWWGFVRWRDQQGRDANLGTAIMSRRFRNVGSGRLKHWFDLYERRREAQS